MKLSELIEALTSDKQNSDVETTDVVLVIGDKAVFDFDVYEYKHPELGWVIGIDANADV